MCDSTGNAHRFKGTVEDGRLDVDSAGGAGELAESAGLRGRVAGSVVKGTIATPDGTLRFRAPAAKGDGGLYVFRKHQNGRVTARSARGNRLSLRFSGPEEATGTVKLADGGERPFDPDLAPRSRAQRKALPVARRFQDARVVLLDSGIGKGHKTKNSAATPDGSPQLSCCWWEF